MYTNIYIYIFYFFITVQFQSSSASYPRLSVQFQNRNGRYHHHHFHCFQLLPKPNQHLTTLFPPKALKTQMELNLTPNNSSRFVLKWVPFKDLPPSCLLPKFSRRPRHRQKLRGTTITDTLYVFQSQVFDYKMSFLFFLL